MTATQTPTPSGFVFDNFEADMLTVGFDVSQVVENTFSSVTCYRAAGARVRFQIKAEQVTNPRVDDLLSVTIFELDDNGHDTGATVVLSHLTERNAVAAAIFITAQAGL